MRFLSNRGSQTAAGALLVALVMNTGASPLAAQNELKFHAPAGVLLVQVKPNKTNQFEQGIRALQTALRASADPTHQALAASWKFFRASEPMGSERNALYVVLVDPATAGTNYEFFGLIASVFPEREAKRLGRELADCFAAPYNKLNVTPESQFRAMSSTMTRTATGAQSGAPSGAVISSTFQFAGGVSATVETKVVETNDVWWKYAWKITLTNKGAAVDIAAVIEFQDSDGFPLESSSAQRSTLPAGDSTVLTGFELVSVSIAPKIKRLDLKVRTAK